MPQRYTNIFEELPEALNADINPYVEELRNSQNGSLPLIYGPRLKDKQGKWGQTFQEFVEGNPGNKLVLEIGCHKGKTIRDMAKDHADHNFLGIDITFKRVVYTAKRAKEANLKNVMSILGDAQQIDLLFAEEELDGVLIFFPDPWSKKAKQQKHRLISPEFCQMVFKLLKKDGYLWFKTDHDEYFAESSIAIEQAGFIKNTTPKGLPSETYETTFERKFRLMNEPTNEGVWGKK